MKSRVDYRNLNLEQVSRQNWHALWATLLRRNRHCQNVFINCVTLFHFISVAQSCPTLCDPMNRSTPGLPCPSPTPGVQPNSCALSRWCHPAISSSVIPFSSCPQSLPASVFSNESALRMRWPKYWSFSLSISPSNEHPGLVSFRMNWLDLLAIQVTLFRFY